MFRIHMLSEDDEASWRTPLHLLLSCKILRRAGAGEESLSNDEVHFRQRRDGPIAITPPRQLPEFPNNLVGVFALLMWAVAIMSVEAYGIQQAIQMVEIRATIVGGFEYTEGQLRGPEDGTEAGGLFYISYPSKDRFIVLGRIGGDQDDCIAEDFGINNLAVDISSRYYKHGIVL
ncbi:hypothetical protein EMCRGX_G000124 [Ephydatia muelleri]